MILIDSNLIVAGLVEHHEHHTAALALLALDPLPPIMVAAHSYAEAFVTLTRRNGTAAYGLEPARVRASLAELRTATTLIAMTAEQTIDAIERFADILRALFPEVAVHTPAEWLALNPAPPPLP